MRLHVTSPTTTPSRAFRWTAILLALSVWLLGVLTVSPALHAALHGDTGQADHTCAVTLFSHGIEMASPAAGFAGAPVFIPEGTCAVRPALPVAVAEYQFPPGRGPPLC